MISGTSGTGSFSNVTCDYITEEKLKMYGIKSIHLLSDEYGKKLFIEHLDTKQYCYNATGLDINSIIKQHINKYCIREIRKEKLKKISK